MTTDVIMPKLGESITEGTILEWKKNIGDSIQRDETILEISTDKVDSEVPSPASGVLLEILYNANETVPVGEIIAKIGDSIDEKPSKVEKKQTISDKKSNSEENISLEESFDEKKSETDTFDFDNERRFFSPLVKSIAKKEGVSSAELRNIKGSGHNSRVNKNDILNYVKQKKQLDSESLKDIDKDNNTNINNQISSYSQEVSNSNTEIEPMGHIRKMIAKHMIKSRDTSVHVYSSNEVDMTSIVNFRSDNKKSYDLKYDTSLTYTPFITRAVIKAINEYPLINCSIIGENISHNKNINMGIAVALPDNNLIVPVIKNSEELNFLGLTRSTNDLANRARLGNLTPNEAQGSSFTITNPGIFGSLFGMGIINQPNVAILSVGSIHKRPVVKETDYGDVIVPRSMMYLTLAYDHRIIDGAYGTKFLGKIKELLEHFSFDEIEL